MPSPEPERYRILVADDEPPILEEYQAVLRIGQAGKADASGLAALDADLFGNDDDRPAGGPEFDLELCHQSDAAVAAVQAALDRDDPIAVAFLDVRMPPGPDGIVAAEKIRAIDPNINIVIVTGYSDVPLLDIVARVPPVDRLLYCKKPLQASELRQFAIALTRKWHVENELRRKIVSQTDALRAANEDLTRTVEDLQRAMDAALSADRAKSRFLANMSHELRTPLNAIIGYTDLLQTGAAGDAQRSDDLRRIASAAEHLLGLVDSVLDYSKIDSDTLELNCETVDLAALLSQVEMLVGPMMAANRNRLEVSQQIGADPVVADPLRLRQALLNLLSNAAKFTEDGAVRLEATEEPKGWLSFAVSDTGAGIGEDQLQKIFEPFDQGALPAGNDYGGTGLGLSICKTLVELMGGAIEAESEIGQGSRFTIRLPRAPHGAETAPATGGRAAKKSRRKTR